jgi:uncharacterized protein
MERIIALGHKNILSTHKTTTELTKEDFLTHTGDCIIGVNADKACVDLPEKYKELLKLGRKVRLTLECNGFKDVITARGDPRLTLESRVSLVIRKSDFVCGRTLCVRADKAAADLDRGLIEELKKGGRLTATLEVLD